MLPELFHIPILDWPVRSYGAMLTVGFLSGVWLAMKRAQRLKADPDHVLNIGFVCLVCAIVGSRLFYVIHYWESSFKHQASPLLAALNFSAGGLEYYGGLIGAIAGAAVYVWWNKISLRMYFDILAPSAAWGLAFGRIGCLLNGCCWGGVCTDAHGHAAIPWGIRFPHGSPAQMRQWENRQLTLPAELIVTAPRFAEAFPVPLEQVQMPVEKREGPGMVVRQLERQIADVQALKGDAQELARLRAELATAREALQKHNADLFTLRYAMAYPSRHDPSRSTTVSEIGDLMAQYPSQPVHPSQVYGVITALVISWVLLELLYRRKRHGVVFAALCVLYPIARMLEEAVRVDNPHDSAGLTISQAVSVGMFLFGVATLIYLRRVPLRSPLAVAYVPPPPAAPK